MKLTKISKKFFELCSFDPEVMQKEKRPYLVVVKLKYSGHRQDFAMPLRSNLPNHVPKEYYFTLPPRAITKKNHVHCIHYVKMFPVKKEYLQKYRPDDEHSFLYKFIERNKKQIITEAQRYLDNYQKGKIPEYSTQIHNIYQMIHTPIETLQEVAIHSPEE